MPLARWKDLCLDAVDVPGMADFWAGALGLRASPSAAGPTALTGAAGHETVWINPVDRPARGPGKRNRLHLDVYAASVADLEALGARVLAPAEETGLGWTVMADPEGGELCCFVREQVPARRLHGIGIDCVDHVAQAAWWGRVLGVETVVDDEHGVHTLEHATPDPVLTLDFAPVPEPRVGPNRVHWDLYADPQALLSAGATHRWDTEGWTVLADPEGNEFCAFWPA